QALQRLGNGHLARRTPGAYNRSTRVAPRDSFHTSRRRTPGGDAMRRTARAAVRTLTLTAVFLHMPHTLAAQDAAQERSPDPFAALQWQNIGPDRGGRSIAVAGSDARPMEYYFGATGGGLWK